MQLCRAKFLFHPKDLGTTFAVNNFDYSSFLFFQAMADLNMPFVNFNTNLFENTTHRFLKDTIVNRIRGANNLQSALTGIMGVFTALPFNLTSLSTSLSLIVLTTAITAWNFFKWVRVSLTSYDRSVICEPWEASLFRTVFIQVWLVCSAQLLYEY